MEIMPGVSIEDVMKEIGSMASGNATIALTNFFMKNKTIKENLFNAEIEMMPKDIKYFQLSEAASYFKDENIGVAYNVNFSLENSTANAIVHFPRYSSLLIPMLVRGKYTGKEEFVEIIFDEDISTILMVASTVSKSYISTLKEFLNVDINENYSNLLFLQEKDMDKYLKGETESDKCHIISVEVFFTANKGKFKGELKFLLVLKEIDTLVRIIKKKWGIE